eukprot:TRINITY_DN462_c1_g1_i6.p1 TRINITY_DN462_c1_g1~~TRINITY_DN462_c1_g1_i6.p1  ORF type:complete len:474 (+),score=136.64 TRINITY_DN462_c1_g1_i6:530-1951(+)
MDEWMEHEQDTTLALLAGCLLVVGFSGGGTFVAALSTAIRVSPPGSTGTSISLVGGCMSLSLGFTVIYLQEVLAITGCVGDHCWVEELRYLGIGLFAIQFPSFLLLYFLEDTEDHAVYHVLDADIPEEYTRLRNDTDADYTVDTEDHDNRSPTDNNGNPVGSPNGPYGSVAKDPNSRTLIDIPGRGRGNSTKQSNRSARTRIDFGDESLPNHYKSSPNPSYGTSARTNGLFGSTSGSSLSSGGSSHKSMSFADDSGFTPRTKSRLEQVASMKPVAKLYRSHSTMEIPVEVSTKQDPSSPPKKRMLRSHSTSELLDNVPRSPAFSHEPLTMIQSLIILKERYFWFMVVAFFAGIGSGLFIIGNTVQLITYFDTKVEGLDVYVSLVFSIMNGVGTIASGALSDYMKAKHGTSPSKILGGSLAMMGVLQIVLGIMDMFPSSGIISDLIFGTCTNGKVGEGGSWREELTVLMLYTKG